MADQVFLPRAQLQHLIEHMQSSGYRCVGPKIDHDCIVYDDISHQQDLPLGIQDQQGPGQYRLQQHTHSRHFAWANGPQAIKPLTFAPHETLWECKRSDTAELEFCTSPTRSEKIALFAVRACDLAAYQLQKEHFLNQELADPWFKSRSEALFIIAVHCSHPSANCFCASTGDGPEATRGYDLAMHELDDGYVIAVGSEAGEDTVQHLQLDRASTLQLKQCNKQIQHATHQQTRHIPVQELKTALLQQLDHPHWKAIGERCLSCANCTAVCPSCFCHQQHDEVDLTTETASHYRDWSSCFSHNHGYLAGHPLRPDSWQRYRQWLTHKFANWQEQYGRIGCTGCGRCISWCPVGIDVVEELNYFCETQP
ncbi:MAG: 4Fe-4S dicluster domain-containing protein [Gammaproteobacteria bacterium]